ncbi:MAG: helix-turn-helix transcriptional regulator [Arachnia sp.]
MKSDTETISDMAVDAIERAHLRSPGDTSHTMSRYDAPAEFTGFLRRFWIPVWNLASDRPAPQRVLQYPVCLLVVSNDYARFYGVKSNLATTTLSGDGWAVGVMCEPAAGFLLTGASMHRHTDRHVDLSQVLGVDALPLVEAVRSAMASDPRSSDAHRLAMAAYTSALRRFLPVDAEGELVNRIVAHTEAHADVTRVAQVCDAFQMSERSLQRLIRRRLGLTPKWLIQRRRLHDAVAHLREGATTLADVAAQLGYADEPHFIRDFSRATGMTPGRFAAAHRG